ncbi:MAG TPA: hypothetical protein VM580_23685 [Labilithrix sp.]|nr:hypothetical protein [Labilithrix sp.]
MSADEVIEVALARFAATMSHDAVIYDEMHGPLYIVGEDYESSRLLVPGWLASFRGKVEGAPIAIVPHRSKLMVGGSARPEMITRLLEIAEREFSASPRSISVALYSVDELDHVVPFISDDLAVRLAHEKLALFEYGQQKDVLDEKQSELFVATYSVFSDSEGGVRSSACWTRAVETLLPKTEWLSLVTPNADQTAAAEILHVPWDAVAHRLTPAQGFHPPRFRTGEFPDETELAALRVKHAK